MSAVLIGFTWWIAGRIWLVANQSAPIIDLLIRENGGPLTSTEWYNHVEARGVFSAHGDDVETSNRFGRHIDGGVLDGFLLMLKVSVSFIALLSAGATAIALPRRWATLLLTVIVASAIGLLAPLIIYSETIGAVSNIVE